MSEFLEYYVEFECPKCGTKNEEPVEFEMQNRETFVKNSTRTARCYSCHTQVHMTPTIALDVQANVDERFHKAADDDESDEE